MYLAIQHVLKFDEELMKITLIIFIYFILSSESSLKTHFDRKFKKLPQGNLEMQVVSKFEVGWMKTMAGSLSEWITGNKLETTFRSPYWEHNSQTPTKPSNKTQQLAFKCSYTSPFRLGVLDLRARFVTMRFAQIIFTLYYTVFKFPLTLQFYNL